MHHARYACSSGLVGIDAASSRRAPRVLNSPFVIAGAVVLMIVSHWLEKRRNRENIRWQMTYQISRAYQLGVCGSWDPLWGDVLADEYWHRDPLWGDVFADEYWHNLQGMLQHIEKLSNKPKR